MIAAARVEVRSVGPARMKGIRARSGRTSIEIEGLAYHSPYQPARQVRTFYAGLLLEEVDVVLHFGWGQGYLGVPLSEGLKADVRASCR